MCGVAGIYSLSGSKINDLENKLKKILSQIKHRGPDQEGFFLSKKQNCGLVNNRLSIVSPKEKIKLPFTKNNNHFLSFNGEIYNFEELKKKLQDKNLSFISSTDTEVLYELLLIKKNYNNLEELNGMWSFAFYDETKHKLLLSRDLLGEKHLFYTIKNGELIFCSEIEPLLSIIGKSEINYKSLIGSWKFNMCLPGESLIKNIKRIKPGENILFESNLINNHFHSQLRPEKWFDFFKTSNDNDIYEKFEEIFKEELKLRIPKDVDFFSTLSGGIDSSILNYFLKSNKKSSNSIFGISSPSQNKNFKNLISEVELSKIVSKELNTNHIVENLYEKKGYQLLFDNANSSFDGCFDPGLANIMSLSEIISKKNCKVALWADGPDELLSGYEYDIEANRVDEFLSGNKKQEKLNLIKKFKITKFFLSKFLNLKKNINLDFSYKPFLSRTNHLMTNNKFLKKIFNNFDDNEYLDYCILDNRYSHLYEFLDFSQLRSLIYATKSLPDMFNYRLDKASMRYSVEPRLPFLSKRVVEFFIAIPKRLRFSRDKKLGKMFLRTFLGSKSEILKNYVCERPKIGLGDNFWSNKSIYEELNMLHNIDQNSFDNLIFNKNVFKLIINNKKIHKGQIWNAYVFSKTKKNLEKNFN